MFCSYSNHQQIEFIFPFIICINFYQVILWICKKYRDELNQTHPISKQINQFFPIKKIEMKIYSYKAGNMTIWYIHSPILIIISISFIISVRLVIIIRQVFIFFLNIQYPLSNHYIFYKSEMKFFLHFFSFFSLFFHWLLIWILWRYKRVKNKSFKIIFLYSEPQNH